MFILVPPLWPAIPGLLCAVAVALYMIPTPFSTMTVFIAAALTAAVF